MLRDPSGVAKTACVMAWIWLATSFALAVQSGYEIAASDPPSILIVQDAMTPTILGLGAASVLVSLLTFGTILRWVYRVNRNARCWSDAVTISPAWNVLSFFVPIVSLFQPYQGIRQSWSATVAPDDPAAVAAPQWMELCWQLWVATTILGGAVNRLQSQSHSEKAALLADQLTILAFAIHVPLVILLCRLLRTLGEGQRGRIVASRSAAEDGAARHLSS